MMKKILIGIGALMITSFAIIATLCYFADDEDCEDEYEGDYE